ncbi:MAG: hypothetical protein PHE29_10660 [Tissierellia bacterium]|nr:hypothetical protein [Tissierellia bacterium]
MDFDNDYKLNEALAEILKINNDIVEELNLEVQAEINNDDMLCSYYVEFPALKDVNPDIIKGINQEDIDKIPWGKTKFYSESQLGNTKADPFGWKAEWEAEEYYNKIFPSKENIIDELEKINNKISTQIEDEIVVKALLFSAFSITESYMRLLVWEIIPNFDFTELDDKLKAILKKDLIYKLTNSNKRIELYKNLTNNTLKPIPLFIEVRHPLAHNMYSACIVDNMIVIKNKNDITKSFDINTVMEELIKYVKNPVINI